MFAFEIATTCRMFIGTPRLHVQDAGCAGSHVAVHLRMFEVVMRPMRVCLINCGVVATCAAAVILHMYHMTLSAHGLHVVCT